MLEISNLCYQKKGRRLLEIEQLDIKTAAITALLGPNGAGKSTLLKVICGDYSYQGLLSFHGRNLNQWPNLQRARHIAFLPQSSDLSFPFTAAEVVSLGLIPLSLSRRSGKHLVKEKMMLTDCWYLADRSYTALSGGEKQRLHLARVLVQLSQAEQRPLLLLDEPTSAQDLNHQHKILTMIRELAESQDYSVLAVLHDLNHALRYCHYSTVVSNGEIVFSGRPDEVLRPSIIESVWQYRPELVESEPGSFLY